MTDASAEGPAGRGEDGAGRRSLADLVVGVRWLPVALLLVAAALTPLAAFAMAGPAVWWTVLPVDPSDPDPLVLLVTAAAILLLAIGLARAKRDAFLLAVASLSAAVIAQGWLLAHPVGGLVAAGCLAILVADRRRYVVRAPRAADRLLVALVASALLVAAAGVLVGVGGSGGSVGPGREAVLALEGAAAMVSFGPASSVAPVAGGLLLALVLVGRLALAVGAAGILRPAPPAPRRPSARAVAIVRQHARGGLVPFLLGPEVSAFEPAGLEAVVLYALEGRYAVALGDPVGLDRDATAAWSAFVAWCQGRDLVPAIYQSSRSRPDTWSGGRAFRVGQEAILDLASFGLAGSRRANLRHTVTRAERGGVHAEWWLHGLPSERSALRAGLIEVDAAWEGARGGPSMGFTVGRFDPAELDRLALAVALDSDGRTVAFATFRETGGGGWVLELMRRVPGSVPGAFEACIVAAAEGLRAAGARELSLGLVPLAGLHAAAGPLEERVLAAVARLARPAYDVRGLEFFKGKFDPRWEARYVVVRRRADAVGLTLALLRLHLGPGGLRAGVASLLPLAVVRPQSRTPTAP